MNEPRKLISEELLQAYLDGTLDAEQRFQVESAASADKNFAEQLELQRQIHFSLVRQAPEVNEHRLQSIIAAMHTAPRDRRLLDGQSNVRRKALTVGLAIAASLLAFVTWQQLADGPPKVIFRPVPLTQIYQQTVEQGFAPYYECRDVARFAATFQKRQGRPLWLIHPPQGVRMLGLSYDGFTREATSMLGSVEEKPVMVFVDKVEHDRPELAHEAAGLRVFREAKYGLVFYEVTPHSQPSMIRLFSDTYADGAESP